jgi:uncharacterized protein
VKRVFIDTGGWIGTAVVRDQTHDAAAAYAKHLADGRIPLLTTNYVLAETYTRIRYDNGHAKALAFDALIHEMVRGRQLAIGWVTPAIHDEALILFRRYRDQEFSIVDCASFVVARRKGIREVFGFDRDFVTMGFLLRPS